MLPRLVTAAIVLFWISSLGWLCAVVWAPPESRMAKVDPREVFQVFFAWNESTVMTLLENGSRMGEVTVSGSSGVDRDTDEFSNSMSLSGTIETLNPENDFPGIDLFWRGVAEFDREIEFQSGDFAIRVPGLNLGARITIDESPQRAKATVTMSDVPIFNYDSASSSLDPGDLKSLPFASMFGGVDLLSFLPGEEGVDSAISSLNIDARQGDFSFGGRDLRAYLLIFGSAEAEESLRIFLSEAGEPLRIETDFGFEAISEILMPLDAYLDKEDETPDPPEDLSDD